MNEITKIHLGRQAFTISVDAYKALQAYLHEIKHQVGDKSKDVVEEVELRMAELLAERGVKSDKVVLLKDVDYLKEQLGSPRDFKDEDDTAADSKDKGQTETDTMAPKRLFRDVNNAWLAGVCAGLAKYFGIDATIIRLIFIALLFFGGGGVLLYIVLWLIVPEARTTSEQLQMQGKPVTVGSLKQIVDRADIEGAAKRASNVVGPVMMTIAKIILGIFGVLFVIIAAALLLGVTLLGMYAWVHHGVSLAGDHFFPTGMKETLLLLCGLVVIAVLALFFLLGGLTMLKPTWKAPGWLLAALGCVFILTAAGGATLFLDRAPTIRDRFQSMHASVTIPVGQFNKVVLHGSEARFVYQPDSEYKIEYRYLGKQPVADFNKGIKDGTLTINSNELRHDGCDIILCTYNDRDMQITIHAPSLASVELRGEDASFTSSSRLRQDAMSIVADRNAAVQLSYVSAKNVTLTDRSGDSARYIDIADISVDSYSTDIIDATSDNVVISRAGTLTLNTDRACGQGDELITLLSSIDAIVVNGKNLTQQPGGLGAAQSADTMSIPNCVQVDPGHVSGKMPAAAPAIGN